MRLKNLQTQIQKAQNVLITLISHHQIVLAEVDSVHKAFVHKLTAETMSAIFQFCMPIMPEKGCRSLSAAERSAPLVLGSVCKRWRQTAWSTPRLWSLIVICLDSPKLPRNLSIVKDWLKRSGDLPLSIGVYGAYRKFRSRSGSATLSILFNIIDVFNQYSSRWYHLDLSIPAVCFSRFHGSADAVPPLCVLRLYASDRTANAHIRFCVQNGKPSPEKVMLISRTSLNSVDIQWNNVTQVDVDFQIDDCFELLKQAYKLKHCRLSGISESNSRQSHESHFLMTVREQLIHSELQSLYIEYPSVSLDPFFRIIICPSLTTFGWENDIMPPNSFLSFLKRSSCVLRELDLVDIKCEDTALICFLEALSSLWHLRLSPGSPNYEFKPDNIFKALASTHISNNTWNTSILLPKLRTLTYTTVYSPPSWKLVPRIFGPFEDITENLSQCRRPFRTLRLDLFVCFDVDTGHLVDYIDYYTLLHIKAVLKAGFSVEIIDSERGIDILDLSLKHHGLTKV